MAGCRWLRRLALICCVIAMPAAGVIMRGYAPVTVKTTSGPITLDRPKLRGNPEPFASRLLGLGVTKTRALESLVIASFVRGLSTRDVEAALEERWASRRRSPSPL